MRLQQSRPCHFRFTPGTEKSRRQATGTDSTDDSRLTLLDDAARPLSLDSAFEAICYWFTNESLPREAHTNFVSEALQPLYVSSSPESPFKHAALAIATLRLGFTQALPAPQAAARKHWLRAMSATRNAISELNCSDEILAAIFMLDYYEAIVRRFEELPTNSGIHMKAAMAIIRRRGLLNTSSNLAVRLLAAWRHKHVLWHFRTRQRIVDFDELQFDARFPASQLDEIVVDMTNLFADITDGYHPDDQRCSRIIQQLRLWRCIIPKGWEPFRVDPRYISSSIIAAGVYNGLCDVYSTQPVAQTMNFWRVLMIIALRLLGHDQIEIQDHADDICASVPFAMGDRESLHQAARFPPTPAWLTEQADFVDNTGQPTIPTEATHTQHTMHKGVWLILTPLGTLLDFNRPDRQLPPIKLRSGQLDWIRMQYERVNRILRFQSSQDKSPAENAGYFNLAPSWDMLPLESTKD